MLSNSKIKLLFITVFLIALITGFIAGLFGASVYSYLIAEQPIVEVDNPGE